VRAEVVMLSGSVEIAPRLGKAEAICDLVSTGGTLAANQLREVVVILESEAVLAGPAEPLSTSAATCATQLLRRLDGVLQVRDAQAADAAGRAPRCSTRCCACCPATSAPRSWPCSTASPTAWRAGGLPGQPVLAATRDLKSAGARRLLVLPVEQMLT
jgi:ATP phosphoribosyltransferase